MTHYETLGVGETANQDEIKKAYRKLASQHHPDKGGDTAKFQEIQTAYDVLSNDEKRQMYDLERSGMGRPGGVHFNFHNGGPMDINEIFSQFHGGFDPFAQFRQQQPKRNKDLRIIIHLDLDSTLNDQTKTVSVQTTKGTRETVSVNIPRGITNGDQIKYPNLGDNLFDTIPRGDLFVNIAVVPNDAYHIVNELDLYTIVSVNCLVAIVGGTAIVQGIDGTKFEMTIPPGTQPGTKFRISQQGLYRMNSDQRGNLYAEMQVTVPKDLNTDQINNIKNIINSN